MKRKSTKSGRKREISLIAAAQVSLPFTILSLPCRHNIDFLTAPHNSVLHLEREAASVGCSIPRKETAVVAPLTSSFKSRVRYPCGWPWSSMERGRERQKTRPLYPDMLRPVLLVPDNSCWEMIMGRAHRKKILVLISSQTYPT